jgi:hypothetical protein
MHSTSNQSLTVKSWCIHLPDLGFSQHFPPYFDFNSFGVSAIADSRIGLCFSGT